MTATWQNQQNECAPSKDSDQPGHPPSLIRVFAVRMKKAWVLSYPLSAQRWLWSDWADAQADLRLCWAHSHFVGFVMSWLILWLWKRILIVPLMCIIWSVCVHPIHTILVKPAYECLNTHTCALEERSTEVMLHTMFMRRRVGHVTFHCSVDGEMTF